MNSKIKPISKNNKGKNVNVILPLLSGGNIASTCNHRSPLINRQPRIIAIMLGLLALGINFTTFAGTLGGEPPDFTNISTDNSLTISAAGANTITGTIGPTGGGGDGQDQFQVVIPASFEVTSVSFAGTNDGNSSFNLVGCSLTGTSNLAQTFSPPQSNCTLTYAIGTNFAVASTAWTVTVNTQAVVVNSAPTVSGTPASVTVTEDVATNINLSAVTVADADGDNLTVTLTANAGTMTAITGGSVTVGGTGTGTLTLSGTAANINTFLDTTSSIKYTSASNDTTSRNIAVKANDGTVDSSTSNITVNINAVNDAPTNIALSASSINQSTTGTGSTIGNLSSTDIDSGAFTYSLVASGSSGTGSCGASNDADNASFQATAAVFETSASLNPGSYKVCIQTSDGDATFQKTFTILVNDNVAPTISSVSIPNSAHKVGDTVTATITVVSDTDDYTAGGGGISGTIDGYALGAFSKTNNTIYTATFTITDGGTDVAAASNLPVNFTLTDSSGNTSGAFTTAISQASDAIYANLPTVNLTASTNTLAEDGGTSTLTGTLSGSLNNQWPVNVTVNLAYTGTATINSDYTGAAAITISSGSSTGTTVVTSLADTLFDATVAETIIIDISSLSVGNEGGTNQQTLSITDAESAPTTTLSVGNASVLENGGTSSITATLSNATFANVTVNLTYSGTATLGGTDANTPSASITIVAGATSGNVVTGITSVDDASTEGDETIIIDIASVSGGSATENGTQQQAVTITDDEIPQVSLSISSGNIAEATGVSTVTATLGQSTFEDVTITLGYTGTATNVTDYTKSNTITVLTGNTTGTTDVTAVQDTLAEVDETIIIDITNVAGGAAVENGVQQQTVTIADDEVVNVSLTASPVSFNEAGGTSTITATLDQATFEDVTVNLAYVGTATIVTDYATAGNITVTAGQTTGSSVLTGVADGAIEGNETIIVDITGVAGGSTIENGVQQLTLTLTDANNPPVVNTNDDPVLTNIGADSVDFIIGETAVILDDRSDAKLSDVDSPNFNKGKINVSISANRADEEDQLLIGTVGTISVSETDIVHSDSGGTIIGDFTGGAGSNNLVVSLNTNATPARVQDLIRALQYLNTDATTINTEPRTVSITVSDGDGGTSSTSDVTVKLMSELSCFTPAPISSPIDLLQNNVLAELQDTNAIVGENNLIGLIQDSDTKYLTAVVNDTYFHLRPISADNAPLDTLSGVKVTENGVLQLDSDAGSRITVLAEPQQISNFNNALNQIGLVSQQNSYGMLQVATNIERCSATIWYATRTAYGSTLAENGAVEGIFPITSSEILNTLQYVHYFHRNEILYRQNLYPAAADWDSLKNHLQQFGTVDLDIEGHITLQTNETKYLAITDYLVELSDQGNGEIQLLPISDINGDGIADFQIVYSTGEKQKIFLIKIDKLKRR